jgi:hypothetical protein
MKIGMIGVISNPVRSQSSHNGGWTKVCKSIIDHVFRADTCVLTHESNWDEYDMLFINEGVNYKPGVYNFFGGVQDSTVEKLKKLHRFRGKVYAINDEIDYNDMINKRKELSSLELTFEVPEVFDMSTATDDLVLGDSHSISVHRPGQSISRNDGKTLYGFLKKGIRNYVPPSVKKLTIYAGNIDVRFHVERLPQPEITVENLCLNLERQLQRINIESICIVGLLPIESEIRKIPNTGKYKGQSFFGSREDRSLTVLHFNRLFSEICKRNGWEYLRWDFDYSKELSYDHMEARQSVHLRPTSYMFNETRQLKLC